MSIVSINSWKDVDGLQNLCAYMDRAEVCGNMLKTPGNNEIISIKNILARFWEYAKAPGDNQAAVRLFAEKLLRCDIKILQCGGRLFRSLQMSNPLLVDEFQKVISCVQDNNCKQELIAQQTISETIHTYIKSRRGVVPRGIDQLFASMISKTPTVPEIRKNLKVCIEQMFPRSNEIIREKHAKEILENILEELQAANQDQLASCVKVFSELLHSPKILSAEQIPVPPPAMNVIPPTPSVEKPIASTTPPKNLAIAHCPMPRDLVEDFENRPWGKQRVKIFAIPSFYDALGYLPLGKTADDQKECQEKDRQRLLDIMAAHNAQFADKIFTKEISQFGVVEPLNLEKGNRVCIRADVHSDLRTVITQLRLLQKEKLLDENFICAPGVHIVFLGDYMDRGCNDVEVMSLLLTLRMQNPNNVHLERGNHEDVNKVNLGYSDIPAWIQQNETLFTNCYKTMPLGICLLGGNPQGVLATHALFAPQVSIRSIVTGEQKQVEVCDTVQDPINTPQDFEKVAKLSQKMEQAVKDVKEWIKAADEQRTSQQVQLRLSAAEFFTWTRMTGYGTDTKGSKEAVRAWMRLNGIKHIIRGHEHSLIETQVPAKNGAQKVLVRTLPTGAENGLFRDRVGKEIQGVLLTITGPNVKEWEQQLFTTTGVDQNFSMKLETEKKSIFAKVLTK
jgi:hypothetical protein